jgi:hypothetical protein
MKASIVATSAALVGSVAASAHKAHAEFHLRGYAAEEICTAYTTVYVYPSGKCFDWNREVAELI